MGMLDNVSLEEFFLRNPKMKVFVDEYLTGAHTGKQFNATRAYEYAGYKLPKSNPSTHASRMLRHPKIREYIKKVVMDMTMSMEEVMMRFSDVARGNIGEIVTRDGHGNLTMDPEKVLEKKHLIKQFGFDSNGNPKVEFHDSMDALKQMARVYGMYKDQLGLTGPGGSAVLQVKFVSPDGEHVDIGPTSEANEEQEDFSDLED